MSLAQVSYLGLYFALCPFTPGITFLGSQLILEFDLLPWTKRWHESVHNLQSGKDLTLRQWHLALFSQVICADLGQGQHSR